MKAHRRKNKSPVEEQAPVVKKNAAGPRPDFLVPIGLAVFLMTIYLATLLPGVNSGDSAELQYKSPLLGMCHPPGYQIEICFGWLFGLLPFGADVAWRMNFMMGVFGTIGAVALYDAVRRITGLILPGLVSAGTLAFSSIYWTHCLYAEAYVFYGSFLMLGIWSAARFVQSNRAVWLCLTALFTGVCVADRASELFVLPAFVLLWLFVRRKIRLGLFRLFMAAVIFVLPFVFTVSFFLLRSNPEQLHARDGAWRDYILAGKPCPPDPASYRTVRRAVNYCLGLNYTSEAGFKANRVKGDIDKYIWLLGGRGVFGDRYPAGDKRNAAQGSGASIGLLGLALAVGSLVFGRSRYGWVLLGAGMFAGNLMFILWHSRWDNLTFTVPGLTGLAILAGLGAAGLSERFFAAGASQHNDASQSKNGAVVFQALCLIVPAFLLASNWRHVDMSGRQQKELLEYNHKLAAAPFPQGSVIVDTYWPAMTYRYLFYIEANRPDMWVMYADPDKWGRIIDFFSKRGQPVFLNARYVNPGQKENVRNLTPLPIAKVGFLCINPHPQTGAKK